MVEAHAVGDGDEHLQRRVAGAGAHAGERAVDAGRAVLQGNHVVRDAEPEIVVRVHAELGLRHIEHVGRAP